MKIGIQFRSGPAGRESPSQTPKTSWVTSPSPSPMSTAIHQRFAPSVHAAPANSTAAAIGQPASSISTSCDEEADDEHADGEPVGRGIRVDVLALVGLTASAPGHLDDRR